MIQVRTNIFETNSSMTHALVMCEKTKYDKWVAGEMMFKMNGHQFADNANARTFNAYHLRDNLEMYQNVGRYVNHPVFNEENIKKYENGELNNEFWGSFCRYEIEYFFITFKQWQDYVSAIGMCDLEEYGKILVDDKLIDIVGFGYYGHD